MKPILWKRALQFTVGIAASAALMQSHTLGSSTTAPEDHAAFNLSETKQQMIGVKTGIVEKKMVFKEIEASGRVAFDPELYTAQSEYLEAIRQMQSVKDSPVAEAKHSAMAMVSSAKTRLRVLGLSDQAISRLAQGGTNALLIPKAGEQAWIYAEVFEMDLPYVQPGLDAKISGSALEGETLTGKVISIDRVLNPMTRTAKVRIEAKAAESRLRPESYVNVSIRSPLGEQLVVPFDAVFDTGKQAWVFVTDGQGHFEPRLIVMKFRANDHVAVSSGLKEGERIVTSANFLIDSESRLKGVQEAALKTPMSQPECPGGQHWDVPMVMCMPN